MTQAQPRPKSPNDPSGVSPTAAHRTEPLPTWLHTQFDHLIAQRGHAWLLHGAAGLGQWELAWALVRGWLCDTPAPNGMACGQCASCHAADVHTHPDLRVLMPEDELLARGWPLDERAQAELDEKKRKPAREIRVEALRSLITFCQRTSSRDKGRAVLIYQPERMNTIAANALLKTLEEPPGHTRFVLASEGVDRLLPTIRSRCMAHALHWPEPSAALSWLHGHGMDAAHAPTWLALAGGLPAQALEMARGERSLDAICAMPRQIASASAQAFFQGMSGPQMVQWLQKICHDLLCVAQGAAPRYFRAADLPTPATMPLLLRWAQALTQSARTAAHPFNAALQQEALLAQARAVLNSASSPAVAARARGSR